MNRNPSAPDNTAIRALIMVRLQNCLLRRTVLSGARGDRRIKEAVDLPDFFGTEAKFSRGNYSRNLSWAAKANNGGGHGGVP